jgi:hypothetical protein
MTRRRVRRSRLVIMAAMLLVAGIGASIGYALDSKPSVHTSLATNLGPPNPQMESAIRDLVAQVAAQYGDSHPTGSQVVPSNRRAANELASGADTPDATDVYVVVVHGHFVSPRTAVDATPPHGQVMTLAIDPTTLSVLDLTLSQSTPDLSQLGKPTQLG